MPPRYQFVIVQWDPFLATALFRLKVQMKHPLIIACIHRRDEKNGAIPEKKIIFFGRYEADWLTGTSQINEQKYRID